MANFLDSLAGLIADRKENPREGSYTNFLLANPDQAAQKVGEEAAEALVAALTQSKERLVEEIADLVYHSMVLLATREATWPEVVAELERRHRGG